MNAFPHFLAAVVVVGLVLIYVAWATVVYPRDCRSHGGVHTTLERGGPACWTADGRRVFW